MRQPYKRSPYFVGSKHWDGLHVSDIDLPDIFSFKQGLKRNVLNYCEFLTYYMLWNPIALTDTTVLYIPVV